jgi:lipopolysaccharide/colanic/teichoic acid biosynthesis glycosyltransferase
MKRLSDIAVSAAVLLLGMPLLIVIGVLVWFDSGRPVFFSQQRAGRGFKPFRIWKFRSMRSDASGPSVTVAGDRRVTRVGAILRTAKLDELPQFWNVLRGDMSLVGPRPEIPEFVELYREQYSRVLRTRPGITDLASLVYRHEERILAAHPDPEKHYREVALPAKLKLAEVYIARQSLALDVAILFRTLLACSTAGKGKHAEPPPAVSSRPNFDPAKTVCTRPPANNEEFDAKGICANGNKSDSHRRCH